MEKRSAPQPLGLSVSAMGNSNDEKLRGSSSGGRGTAVREATPNVGENSAVATSGGGKAQRRILSHGLAGVLAGCSTTAILQPFDVLKTRLQVSGATTQTTHNYRNSIQAMTALVKKEGAAALYKGATPNILGNAMAWGTYMLGYNTMKTLMKKEDEPLSHAQHWAAGISGGIVALLFVNPVWVVKTRMILQTNADRDAYKSTLDAFRTIWRKEGVQGFYRGLRPGLVGTTHGGFQFMMYEALKKHFQGGDPSRKKLDTVEYLSAATVSKWFAGTVTYPYQVVRARDQIRGSELTAATIVKNIFRNQGLKGFYQGLGPYLLRTVPSTCIYFFAYENLVHLMDAEFS